MQGLFASFAMFAHLAPLSCVSPQVAAPPAIAAGTASANADLVSDLDVLVTEIASRHVQPFSRITREAWVTKVEALKKDLPRMTRAQAGVAVQRLVTHLGDAHTVVNAGPIMGEGQFFPLGTVVLEDGVVITAAPPEHQDLNHGTIVSIDGTSIADVVERVGGLIPSETRSWRRFRVGRVLMDAQTLFALGLIKQPDRALVTARLVDGTEKSVMLTAEVPGPSMKLATAKLAMTALSKATLARREWCWFTALSPAGENVGPRVVYLRYDKCQEQKGLTISAVAAALRHDLTTTPADRVIVDLRSNTGGDSTLFEPLAAVLRDYAKGRPAGSLIGLVGGGTFSSGVFAAKDICLAGGLLVGDEPGTAAVHFGEVKSLTLPKSGLKVFYSTKRFELPPCTTQLALRVTQKVDGWRMGRDEALEAAIEFVPQPAVKPAP